jgi:manganese transport protein
MNQHSAVPKSLGDVHASVDTTKGRNRWQRFFAFLGPAYLVSVGYMDPGNWATDLAAGSKFGYSLLWVLLMSNLMALLLQSLSARLGIVRRTDLAQANRAYYPRKVNFALYLLAEVAIAATDLAEVLGMAIGLHLLFDMPILWGVVITLLDTFLLLYLQRLGMRKMELFILGLVFVIGLSFLINLAMASPQLGEVLAGFVPGFPDAAQLYQQKGITGVLPTETALYLAIGIIGATVMPHNLYLHSALVQTRKIGTDHASIKKAIKANFIDTAVALNLAFFVNAGILVLSAAIFFNSGRTDVGEIEQAHQLLQGMLGSAWAPKLFAIALIAAGQSSTITGTLAGQIVMEGYLRLRLNPWVRRLLTRCLAVIPAVLVILINGPDELDNLLILSQVILSAQLGFAVIPLVHFVSDKGTMGQYAIGTITQVAAWAIAAVLVYLNARLLAETLVAFFESSPQWWARLMLVVGAAALAGLLVYILVFPLFKRITQVHRRGIHAAPATILPKPLRLQHIAIALDFGPSDAGAISHALAQGGKHCQYHLIHIVESAASKYLGQASADDEAHHDAEHLNNYARQLHALGYRCQVLLGYRSRVAEIVRLTQQANADLLVMGSHGHRSFSDLLYGSTVDAVRHRLAVPVLAVKS